MNPKRIIADIIDFNPTRSIKRGEKKPFIDMASIQANFRDITNYVYREYKGGGSRFSNGDTLFARITPCLENGKTAKINCLPENEIGHGSTEFIVMSAKEPEYDEDFIYYLSRLPHFRAYAQSRMEGTSGRQRVTWQSLADYKIEYPEREIRRRIGSFLRVIDDKILQNTKINQTLEQIAQAIFKNWFVDFNPVEAKIDVFQSGGTQEEAERTAMSVISGKNKKTLESFRKENPEGYAKLKETAALFPAGMVDSELGMIPEGWEVGSLGDVYDITMGQSPKGTSYNEAGEGTLFFQGRAEFGWRYPKPRLYTTDPKRMASNGDVLMSVRAPVGDLNIALSDCCVGRGLAALKSKVGGTTYSYYQLRNIQRYFERFNAEGTVFGSINQKDLKSIKVIVPDEKLINRFLYVVGKMDKQIESLSQQVNSLETIRDTLMPKLLTGELLINGESE
ncbi:restriction endonuclease subunit S [Marispirochaeta aestuarii]|uniref:restriction endonuclease subunit S n=1 Tax=Marispirochaeta aestuarii TaxID=1963862 RepID=UPI0029C67222|nr:restriction endonuclease subunit S [Marispirochaeta aestuarii]